mmetsp:Transcript_11583/g.16642  ORF Transcript_11583/g.16642 Transcript_11583/m.16642 type:complete len:252 (+) Transcript_11583:203-958(+)|eukprot:CAMPEP_0172422844 /NCGR_PEP_ID=MMETSP1064-20121228/8963_1 /TAXON_ID=202472 /ORGANISM="Aulacoseira subarctica , Strain CCAP 1002/5" /LENGTH=251 /DNA_ID=CAMNT_0013163911 /DNA_START=150 /DNA_END=905 /DNA_ORIENTATION=-
MKFILASVIVALSAQLTSSFAPLRHPKPSTNGLFMSELADPAPVLPKMSQSLPFLERPAALKGTLAGDVGFDPFGFAKDEGELMTYREAELKHARLAMLAAAGWPLSEVLDKKIAALLGWTPILDVSDRVPSLLNGGLGKISPLYWVAVVALAGAIDVIGIQRTQQVFGKGTYLAGDFGFDPLGVYPKGEEGKKWMQLAEIKNGRLAMIAVFAFAIQEAVTKVGIVDETPLFFFPLGETLRSYANSGYLQQ